MQRILIALALAFCVSSVAAQVTGATNWAKAPVQIIQDNETSFTNTSGAALVLANANPGELSIVSQMVSVNATSTNQYTWTTWWKKIDTKALTTSGNATTATFTMPQSVSYSNGYAIQIVNEVDTTSNLPTLRVYQSPLNGGAALGKLVLTTGATNTTLVAALGGAQIGKVAYIFYTNANMTIKFTSFTVGSTANATENTLSTAADIGSLQVVWGESLGSSQVLAYWTENGAAKDAVVDVSKGTSTPAAVTGVTTNHTCRAFATDKKLYGELCTLTNNGTITTFVKINSTGLSGQLSSYNATTMNVAAVGPYAGYLAIWFSGIQNGLLTMSYELWDLSTFTLVNAKPAVTYLSLNTTTTRYTSMRIPAGPIYGLLYNIGLNNLSYSSISAGVVLAGSYLTAILGFVMTIVAGLFLF